MPNQNNLTARENAFSQPIINIGRDNSNDLILPGDSVKAFHCMLMSQDGLWQLVPVSTENLSINGQPVTDSRVIENGDILTIGDYRLDLVLNGMSADIFTTALGIISIPTVEETSVNAEQGGSLLIHVNDADEEVRPGNSAEFLVYVTNAGALVANMQLEVQGIDPDWVEIIPPVLNLNESQHGQFTVRVSPPNDPKTLAGTYHLHLALLSPNYPGETAGENVSLKILPFYNYMIGNYSPQQIWANRRNPIAETTFTIRNLSNTELPITLQTTDDANQASYEYINENGIAYSSQMTGSIEAGATETVHLKVRPHKLPIFGWGRYSAIHFTTHANRPEDPSYSQMISGQIGVRPLINIFWVILTAILLAITALIVMLPRIRNFTVNDEQSVIVYSASPVNLKWDVSRFATDIKLTAEDEETSIDISGKKSYSPVIRKSQRYMLTASNWISKTLGIEFSKEISVVEVPHIPEIDLHRSPATTLNAGDSVDLSWNVTSDPNSAEMIVNRVHSKLEADNFSGQSTFPANEDTLVSIIGENETGSVTKSLFIDVKQPKVDMISFAIYVRPDGAAVGADGQTTTWRFAKGIDTEPKKIAAAFKGRYQTILEIPEQEFDSGPQVIPTAIIPDAFVPAPSAPVISAPEQKQEVILPPESGISDAVPQNAPEKADLQSKFTIKLAEAISDPSVDSGYRVINYYPQYSVEKEEQVMLQWTVNGVKTVMVTPLATDPLSPNAVNFYNPKETTNFILAAEANGEKHNYAIPLNVAESDGGDKSCALNISSTSLKAPGNVTLNWVSQGITRLQLLSDVQANEDTKEEEEQTKEEAEVREKKEKGVLSDNLEAAGFMKVNVSQETSFVLRGYDASGEIACNQVQKVSITPEKTKKEIKLTITKTTDKDGNQNQTEVISGGKTLKFDTYRVNQPAWVYFKLSDEKATGTVVITDGKASCTATLPEDKCQLTFTEAGAPDPDPAKDHVKTLSAKYSGDDNFAPATSSYQVKVFPKPVPDISITYATDKEGYQKTIPVETEEGRKWIHVFYTGMTARVTYELKDADGNIIQNAKGKVTISDGEVSCTVEPQNTFCDLTFKTSGNPSPLPEKDYLKTLTATYSGDENYAAAVSADYPIFVYPAFVGIEKTTDKNGVQNIIKVGPYKSDEYDYHIVDRDAMVYFYFPEDSDLKGTVKVSADDVSCEVKLPATGCQLKFTTSGLPDPDPAKDYVKTLSVTYTSEDSSITSVSTYPVKVFPKPAPNLGITKTTDKGDIQNTEVVTYQGETYTFDKHIVENTLNIYFELPETDADGGKITILMEGKEVCSKKVPGEQESGDPGVYKCTTKFEDVGPSFPDNPLKDRVKTITAKYSGDNLYSDISVSYDVKVYPKKDANLVITKTTYDDKGNDRRQIRDGSNLYDLHLADSTEKWIFTELAESDATGKVEIFDGEDPLCTATMSDGKGSCSLGTGFTAGSKNENYIKTLTAKYSGDDNYYPVTAKYKVKVYDKIPTELLINQVTPSEPDTSKDDLKFTFTYDPDISKAIDTYKIDPTGKITLSTRHIDTSKTPITISCNLNDRKCSDGGTVEASFVSGQNITEITLKGISITDKEVAIYKLNFGEDPYFGESESPEFEFDRIKTITRIESIEDLKFDKDTKNLLATVHCSVEVDRYTPSEYQKWIDQKRPDLTGFLRLDSAVGAIGTAKKDFSGSLIAPVDFINFPIKQRYDDTDISATYEGSKYFDDSFAEWTEKIKVDGTKIEFLRPYENTNVKDGMVTADVKLRLTANDDNPYQYKVLHNGILTLYFEGTRPDSKTYVINLAEETLTYNGAAVDFKEKIKINKTENTITIKQVDLYGGSITGAYYAEFKDPFDILEGATAYTPSIRQVRTKVVSGNNPEITENNGTVTLKTEIKVQTPKSEWEALGIAMPNRYYGTMKVWHQNSKDSAIEVNLNDTNIFSDVKEVKAVEGGKDVYYYETSGIVTLNNIVLPTETGEASPVYADYLGNDFMTQHQIIALRPLAYQTSTGNLTGIKITEDPNTGKLSLDFDITVKSKKSWWDQYKTRMPEKFFGTLEVYNHKDGKVLKKVSLLDPEFSTVTENAGYYQSTGHIKMDIGKLSNYEIYCRFSGSNLMDISAGAVTKFEGITPIISLPYNIHIVNADNTDKFSIKFNIDLKVSINTWKNTYGMDVPKNYFYGKMRFYILGTSLDVSLNDKTFSKVIEDNGYYKTTATIELGYIHELPEILFAGFPGTDLMNPTTGPQMEIDMPVMVVSKPYDIIVSKDSNNKVGISFKIDIKSEKRWWENDQYTIDLRDNRFPGRFILHYKDKIEEHHMYATNFFSKIQLKDSYYISTGTFFINDVGALSDSGSDLWGEIIRSDIMPATSGTPEVIKRAEVIDRKIAISYAPLIYTRVDFQLVLEDIPYLIDLPQLTLDYKINSSDSTYQAACTISGKTISASSIYPISGILRPVVTFVKLNDGYIIDNNVLGFNSNAVSLSVSDLTPVE